MLKIAILTTTLLISGFTGSVQSQSTAFENNAKSDIPLSPADGGPRRWQLSTESSTILYVEPSLNAQVMDSLERTVVLTNLGCVNIEDSVWCHVKPIHGKRGGYLLAEHLQPALAPDGTLPVGIDTSARRARKADFDESAEISCAQERGQAMDTCTAEVARSSGSDATVVARFSNGFKRTLHFTHGEFISANATMSGSGSDTDWIKQDNLHVIRVDDQRYELYDEFIFGR